MLSTYKLNTCELTPDFIAIIQTAYPNRDVEIAVQETSDETAYLFSSPKNKQILLKTVDDIKKNKNLVSVSFT